MRKMIKYMIVGGAIGGMLSTWLGPKWISWYFTPPVNFGINCTAPVDWALNRFQWTQFVGVGAGAAVTLILYFVFRKNRNNVTF